MQERYGLDKDRRWEAVQAAPQGNQGFCGPLLLPTLGLGVSWSGEGGAAMRYHSHLQTLSFIFRLDFQSILASSQPVQPSSL